MFQFKPFRILIKHIISPNKYHRRIISNFKRNNIELYYLPSPLQWLNKRADITALQAFWDDQFCEATFLKGAEHALTTVTHHIAQNTFPELTGLFTAKALESFTTEVAAWPKEATDSFPIAFEHIKIAMIQKASLQSIADNKYCDIDVQFVALIEKSPSNSVLMEFFARFYRDYTEGKLPEWTITRFKLLQFSPNV